MFIKSIAVSGLVTAATAHIIMTNPVPYGLSSLSNGPLAADGSDFPCKQREGVYNAEGASNVYAQGSKQQLEFQGTAVHGGGSCQVSITTDLKPTKNSVWKVIKSIEGGCPAKDQAGNMGNDAKAKVPYKYDFTIPEELAAGDYTLAWTWFNKVGNREMYMNCAPLAVTGNAGSQSFLNGLPDMMVANVGDGCSTPDSSDAKFLDPGKDLDRFNGKTEAFTAPVGACGKTGAHPEPTASGTASVQPTSAQPNPSVPTSSGSAPPSSPPGGIFITSPTPQPTPTPAPGRGNSTVPGQSPSKPPPTSVTTSTPIAPGLPPTPTGGPVPGSPPPPSGGHPPGSSCSSEGLWNCIDGKSFQRCASGKWSVPQALSLGMSCQVGESANIKMAGASRIKRAMRRSLRIRH